MAYYNANEMIRLTRRAMGMTQEDLCDEICSVINLSRIENGHCGVKKSVYRKLMERMGRMTEKRYAVCIDKDGMLSDDRMEWEQAYRNQNYKEAERYMRKMRENAGDDLLTRQYLARAEALIAYRRGKIPVENMMAQIDKAICMTVPNYETYLGKKDIFPFTIEELMALMSLGNGYYEMDDNERALWMYDAVSQCLGAGYIGDPDNTELLITLGYNIVNVYSAMGQHLEALERIETFLKMSRERDYSQHMISFLTAKAHNYVRLVEKGMWEKTRLKDAKRLLQQAYSIAVARADKMSISIITNYRKKHFLDSD